MGLSISSKPITIGTTKQTVNGQEVEKDVTITPREICFLANTLGVKPNDDMTGFRVGVPGQRTFLEPGDIQWRAILNDDNHDPEDMKRELGEYRDESQLPQDKKFSHIASDGTFGTRTSPLNVHQGEGNVSSSDVIVMMDSNVDTFIQEDGGVKENLCEDFKVTYPIDTK